MNYKMTLSNIDSAKEMLPIEKDEEMREMAKAELDDLTGRIGRHGGGAEIPAASG